MILIQSIIWLIILYAIFHLFKYLWIDLTLSKIVHDMITPEGKLKATQTLRTTHKWCRIIEFGFMLAIGFCIVLYFIRSM